MLGQSYAIVGPINRSVLVAITMTRAGSESESFSEDQLRAGTYALLAALLRAPPEADLLQRLQAIATPAQDEHSDAMTTAWLQLRQAAETADLAALNDDYHALFIGLGRGELVPYGSWYLTGFLMEKPLGNLRRDLAAFGYERQAGVHEPEDHAGALCETMSLLIGDSDIPFGVQKQFFNDHLGSWLERFFSDLQSARKSGLYHAVGRFGEAFIGLEKQYLAMLV